MATERGRTQQRDAKRRLRATVEGRLAANLRNQLWEALGPKKTALARSRFLTLVGCTVAELRAHLESTFRGEWAWDDYGSIWEIDHERPIAGFDLTDPAQVAECFRWSNLRAYPVFENRSEGARRPRVPMC